MSTFKKHAATGFVAAFIALPAFAQSPAEHPTTPPPSHEKQAPGVEAVHDAAPSAAEVAKEDQGAAKAAENKRAKAEKKEKGHGKGKR